MEQTLETICNNTGLHLNRKQLAGIIDVFNEIIFNYTDHDYITFVCSSCCVKIKTASKDALICNGDCCVILCQDCVQKRCYNCKNGICVHCATVASNVMSCSECLDNNKYICSKCHEKCSFCDSCMHSNSYIIGDTRYHASAYTCVRNLMQLPPVLTDIIVEYLTDY